jgi:hypothetical protein
MMSMTVVVVLYHSLLANAVMQVQPHPAHCASVSADP